MADHKDIDDKIRGSFDGMNEKAPENLWANINSDLEGDSSVDDKVRESFSQGDQKAPEAVWSGVEKQLTIDRAWKGVRGFLVRRTWKRRLARIAAVLLLLIGIASGYYGLQGDPEGKSTSENRTEVGKETGEVMGLKRNTNGNTNRSTNTNGNMNIESEEVHDQVDMQGEGNDEMGSLNSNTNRNRSTNGNGNMSSNTQTGTATATNYSAQNTTIVTQLTIEKDKKEAEEMSPVPGAVFHTADKGTPRPIDLLDTSFTSPKNNSGFEIGVTGGYQMTMVFNNDTRKSFDPESLVLTENNFLPAFGIALGYRFNRNHAILSNVHLYHPIEQSTSSYREGMLTDRSVTIKQQRVSLTYEYSFNRKERILPPQLFLRAGLYAGRISHASLGEYSSGIVAAKKIAPEQQYKIWDFGAILSLGKHITLTDKLMLDLELRSTKGLNNLSNGVDGQPADFNRTTTFTLGGHGTLKYRF